MNKIVLVYKPQVKKLRPRILLKHGLLVEKDGVCSLKPNFAKKMLFGYDYKNSFK